MSESVEVNKDGLARVKDGRISIIDPERSDRGVLIIPTDNIRLIVNGEEKEEATLVRSIDQIEIKLIHTEPSWEPFVSVTSNKLEAYLSLDKRSGFTYKLKDRDDANPLRLETEILQENRPNITTMALKDFLNKQGIVYGLIEENLSAIVEAKGEKEILAAKGDSPFLGQNGYISPCYQKQTAADNSSLIQLHDVDTVEKGEKIAEVIAPIEGKEGKDVYGKPIAVSPVKEAKVTLGPGCEFDETKKKIFSTLAGRPLINGNVVSVQAGYTVKSDVSVKTGHIKVKGDLTIAGNVLDEMKVEATGKISIKGYVANATVIAGSDITVGQHIMGSQVRAGGISTLCQKIASDLGEIGKTLKTMPILVSQLSMQPNIRKNKDIEKMGVGILVRILLQSKYPNFLEKLEAMSNELLNLIDSSPEHRHVKFHKNILYLLQELSQQFPLREYRKQEQLNAFFSKMTELSMEYMQYLQEKVNDNFKLKASYLQNSNISCSGDIVITGKGSYNSNITAGRNVDIQGLFKGGNIAACGNVKVGELGSESEIVTTVQVPRGKFIHAKQIHPRVRLKAGSRIENIRSLSHDYTLLEEKA